MLKSRFTTLICKVQLLANIQNNVQLNHDTLSGGAAWKIARELMNLIKVYLSSHAICRCDPLTLSAEINLEMYVCTITANTMFLLFTHTFTSIYFSVKRLMYLSNSTFLSAWHKML